jgi:hypothetical protein
MEAAMRNPCLDAAITVLEECGIRDREIARGSKHPQIRFRRINGEAALHVFALSGTASDHRSPANTKSALRKYLREHGVITAPERTEPTPPPKKLSRIDECVHAIADLQKQVQALQNGLTNILESSKNS